MKKILMLASALALLTAVPALAHDHMDGDDRMIHHKFKEMDTNSDGVITKDEWQAYFDKKFDEADTKSDGKLTMAEFKAFKMKEHREWKEHHQKHSRHMHSGMNSNETHQEPATGNAAPVNEDNKTNTEQ